MEEPVRGELLVLSTEQPLKGSGLDLRVIGKVGLISLVRPPVNAIDGRLIRALADSFESWRADKRVAAVVVTGGVRNAFCTGGDLKQLFGSPMAKLGSEERKELFAGFQAAFRMIEHYPKPTVAAVNGVAIGGGVELALVCDLRIASEFAFFSLPELRHGFIPGLGATRRLARLVGLGRAKELLLLGRRLRAGRALDWGLVNRVVPHHSVVKQAVEVAQQLAQWNARAVAALKRCLAAGAVGGEERSLKLETESFAQLIDQLIANRGRMTDEREL